MENLNNEMNNLSLKENCEEDEEKKFDLEFEEYIIKSSLLAQDEKFFLPTPDSLAKTFDLNVVKDLVTYDIDKHKSIIKESEEGLILDLNSISSIQNSIVLKLVFLYLGALNSNTDIYEIFEDSAVDVERICQIESTDNYVDYVNKNILLLTYKLQFADIEKLFTSLKEIGINIPIDDKNVLFRNLKDSIMSSESNKIMVLLAPSNNFWIKSERSVINDINYDQKLNNYTKLFYNKQFIKKFLSKVVSHRRCIFGFLSSMSIKNLKIAKEYLATEFKELWPEKIILFDQKVHECIYEGKKQKPKFFRDLGKIKNYLKTAEKIEYLKETNIIILESEEDKISESTRGNSIHVNVFSEQYLEYSPNKKAQIDLEGDKIINYMVKLLENCLYDVRDYIAQNPIK